jgi:tripartite-type tricarboxylate transporter receptor subunit TctC
MIARPALLIALLAALAAPMPAQADPVADFYRGKTINLVVGTSAGNDYDFRGRLIARHIGRHIPGEPIIAPQNMPGAGGIKAANYMAAIAPKDGTTVHMIMTNMMATQGLHLPGSSSTRASSAGSATPPARPTWSIPGTPLALRRSRR